MNAIYLGLAGGFIAIAAIAILGGQQPLADTFTIPQESVIVTDGDTLKFRSYRVRLDGIDAPEMKQVCLSADGVPYQCGIQARDEMKDILSGKDIICRSKGVDRYGRTIARCIAGGVDVSQEMVRRGWALPYRGYASEELFALHMEAMIEKRGMLAGEYLEPWKWRRIH